jgi:hypothetical protein
VLFEDDFLYPDGNLLGHGPWVAMEDGSLTAFVSGHQAIGAGGVQRGNSVLGLLTLPQIRGNWWIELDVIPSASEAVTKDCAIWIGDITGHALFVDVSWDTSFGGGTSLLITAGDQGSVFHSQVVPLGSFGIAHAFVLSYTAADGRLHAWLDGVEVLHVDGLNVALVTDGRLDIAFVSGAVTTQPRATRVRAGLGIYSF